MCPDVSAVDVVNTEGNCSYQDVLNHLNVKKDNELFFMTRPVKNFRRPTQVSLEVLLYAILDVVSDCHVVTSFANTFLGKSKQSTFFCKTTVTLKPYFSIRCRSKMLNISSQFCSSSSLVFEFFKIDLQLNAWNKLCGNNRLKIHTCFALCHKYLINVQQFNNKWLRVLKTVVANKWLIETTELVGDIKRHHTSSTHLSVYTGWL